MQSGYGKAAQSAGAAAFKVTLGVLSGLVLAACSNTGSGPKESAPEAEPVVSAASPVVKVTSLSEAEVAELSGKSCAQFDAQAKVAAAKSTEGERLAQIIKRLPKSVNGVPLNYQVYLSKEVNAWAMDNGCVRVHSGLLKAMNNEEMRAVLGHLIGHVALGDTRLAMQTSYAALAGNPKVATMSDAQLGEFSAKLLNTQFSSQQETAADDYAFDVLTRAKLKRDGLVGAIEKLTKLGNKSPLFAAHPPSNERVQHMRERLASKK